MGYPQKIVTCCYCGTRAALVLKGKTRHELACSNCGAPLHDLKMLPVDRRGDRELVTAPRPRSKPDAKKPWARKGKRRKTGAAKKLSLFKDLAEEAFEFIEDIFD